jgi:hypothetical protein
MARTAEAEDGDTCIEIRILENENSATLSALHFDQTRLP